VGVIDTVWQILFLGLVPASLYAPLATGLVLVYRSSGVLNFAQGAFAFVGAYLFYAAADSAGLPFGVSVIIALAASFVIGLLIQGLLIRPILGASPVIVVMVTIALQSILEAAIFLIFGTSQQFLNAPLAGHTVHIFGGVDISLLDLVIVVVTVVVLVGLTLALRFARTGVAIRAVADSPLLAGTWGYNANRLIALTWGVAFALAAMAGIANAMRTALDSSTLVLGTLIFPAVIIGGMDSLGGAIVGSLILGITNEAVTLEIGSQWANFVVYAALILVLCVRPYGLFGTPGAERL
jgi:branched-chain amino acid transport system permease protein